VEQIGVERSRAAAESADLILLVFDGSEPLTDLDMRVSDEVWAMGFGQHNTPRRPVVVVINKTDSPQRLEIEQLERMWGDEGHTPFVSTSARYGAGLMELEEAIVNLVLAGSTIQSEGALVTSARHVEALHRAAQHIEASLTPLRQLLPLDFVSIDLRAAYDALGEVTGETASDDLLERIFSEFCIGK
jgi:tRNA modification GTPase